MAAINEGGVPPELQEPLMARANELVNAVNCPPPADDEADEEEDEDDPGKGKGRGKKKGHDADEPVETVITIPPPEAPQP